MLVFRAGLALFPENVLVSIPESIRTLLAHFPTVELETGLCSLALLMSNLVSCFARIGFARPMYRVKWDTTQIDSSVGYAGSSMRARCFPGLVVLSLSPIVNTIFPRGSCIRAVSSFESV